MQKFKSILKFLVYCLFDLFIFFAKKLAILFFYLKNPTKKTQDEILVVVSGGMGDLILTSPFLRELRRNFRSNKIILVVKIRISENINIFTNCPYVDEIIPYKNPRNRVFSLFLFVYKNIWKRNILYAFGLVSTDIFVKIIAETSKAQKVFRSFNYWPIKETEKPKHIVEKNLDLLSAANGDIINDNLEVWPSRNKSKYLQNLTEHEEKKIILGICAGEEKRIWPIENYLSLCSKILQNYKVNFIVLGDDKSKEKGVRFKEKFGENIFDLTDKTGISDLYQVIKDAILYVGSDTGLMHIAAALKVPVVEISCHPISGNRNDSNSPELFGPWKTESIIIQPLKSILPCVYRCEKKYSHCIKQVTVNEVYTETNKMLNIKNKNPF